VDQDWFLHFAEGVGLAFFGLAGGFGEFFAEGGEEEGPPRFGFWGGVGVEGGGFNRGGEDKEGGGKSKV